MDATRKLKENVEILNRIKREITETLRQAIADAKQDREGDKEKSGLNQ